jgi:hypothetical protein
LPPVYLGDDLARVPEVVFETPPAKMLSRDEWEQRIKTNLARAADLSTTEKDGFVKTLLRERRDLAGLPFLLGDACRISRGLTAAFRIKALAVREAGKSAEAIASALHAANSKLRGGGWTVHSQEAEVAALTQIRWGMNPLLRLEVVDLLAAIPHTRATTELARLAVFDPDWEVRAVAVKSLAGRPKKDYTSVLVTGLRYPWPAAAQNAAAAITKLKRVDLLPQLVEMLDEPDPRLPRKEKVGGRMVSLTHELVRVNHLKSCLLCHASASPFSRAEDFFLAPVPVPSERLNPLPGYNQSQETPSHLLVRADVTYLRQDFSVMQLVAVDSLDNWPILQRFDFLVRKRVLSDKEAADLKTTLRPRLSPYHRVARKALRDLRGRDLPAKADAWRKLLKSLAKRDG